MISLLLLFLLIINHFMCRTFNKCAYYEGYGTTEAAGIASNGNLQNGCMFLFYIIMTQIKIFDYYYYYSLQVD